MELTTQQEDLILERDREQEGETQKELLDDFVSDNLRQLKDDFIEQYEQEWIDFKKKQFEIWFEDYKYSNNK